MLQIPVSTPECRLSASVAEAAAIVFFVNDVDAVCGKAPPGYTKLGCSWTKNGVPYIAVGNPCVVGDVEKFARLMCHEKGHVLQWSGNHEL